MDTHHVHLGFIGRIHGLISHGDEKRVFLHTITLSITLESVVVEVEVVDEGRVGRRGIVRQHLIADDGVVGTDGQERLGKAGITGIVESLGKTQVELGLAVDTYVLTAMLVDGLLVVLGRVEGNLALEICVCETEVTGHVFLQHIIIQLVAGHLHHLL